MTDPTGDLGIDRMTAFAMLFGIPIIAFIGILVWVIWHKARHK